MVLVEFLIKIVLACKMVDAVSNILNGKDAYSIYRRRNDGHKVFVRKKWLDNRWVVPYNLMLLMRYNCHINVEVCSSIKCCKYLYKYVYKGTDCASFAVGNHNQNEEIEINEIK